MQISEREQEGGRGEVLQAQGCGGCRGPGDPLRGDAEGERQRTGEATECVQRRAPAHEEQRMMQKVLQHPAPHRNTNRAGHTAHPLPWGGGGGPPRGRKRSSVPPIADPVLCSFCVRATRSLAASPARRQRPTGNNGLRPPQESSPPIKIPAPALQTLQIFRASRNARWETR